MSADKFPHQVQGSNETWLNTERAEFGMGLEQLLLHFLGEISEMLGYQGHDGIGNVGCFIFIIVTL